MRLCISSYIIVKVGYQANARLLNLMFCICFPLFPYFFIAVLVCKYIIPGSTSAPPGFHVQNAAITTQSSARQDDNSIAFKERTTPEDQSHASTSNFSRNTAMAGGSLSSTRSENPPVRDPKLKHSSLGGSSTLANGTESESLASGLDNISLNKKHGTSKFVIPKKTLSQYKPDKWMLPEKEDGVMAQLNLAIVSHLMLNISSCGDV